MVGQASADAIFSGLKKADKQKKKKGDGSASKGSKGKKKTSKAA